MKDLIFELVVVFGLLYVLHGNKLPVRLKGERKLKITKEMLDEMVGDRELTWKHNFHNQYVNDYTKN